MLKIEFDEVQIIVLLKSQCLFSHMNIILVSVFLPSLTELFCFMQILMNVLKDWTTAKETNISV